MILSDSTLLNRLKEFVQDPDPAFVNSASVDFRLGRKLLVEIEPVSGPGWLPTEPTWQEINLGDYSQDHPYLLRPQSFALGETFEIIKVPLDCAVEMKLKSSRARAGIDHSLAFWFDPGWVGIGTLELQNAFRYSAVKLWFGMRVGQLVVHKLDQPAVRPYSGRYQKATTLEVAKPGN